METEGFARYLSRVLFRQIKTKTFEWTDHFDKTDGKQKLVWMNEIFFKRWENLVKKKILKKLILFLWWLISYIWVMMK